MGTFVVGAILAIIIFFAARSVYKNIKGGGCAGGCSGCSGCNHAAACNKAGGK